MPINKIIVFLAHPDDTDTYCANFISDLVTAGKQVEIHAFTRGEHGLQAHRDPRKEDYRGHRLGRIRSRELIRAASFLGIPPDHVNFLEIEDSTVTKNKLTAYRRVKQILADSRPDLVMAPEFCHGYYQHPDHVAAGQVVFLAMKSLGMPQKLLLYHSIKNTFWYPADPARTRAAVSYHESQRDFFRFILPAYLHGEMRIKGLHLAGVKHAEGYRVTTIHEPQRLDLATRIAYMIFSQGSEKKLKKRQTPTGKNSETPGLG